MNKGQYWFTTQHTVKFPPIKLRIEKMRLPFNRFKNKEDLQ